MANESVEICHLDDDIEPKKENNFCKAFSMFLLGDHFAYFFIFLFFYA